MIVITIIVIAVVIIIIIIVIILIIVIVLCVVRLPDCPGGARSTASRAPSGVRRSRSPELVE